MSEQTGQMGIHREYPWSPVYSSKQIILVCLKAQLEEWKGRQKIAAARGDFYFEASAKLWIRSIEREIINQECVEVGA